MFGLLILLGFCVWILLYRPSIATPEAKKGKISERFNGLWRVAQDALREKKYLRAEKALLTILRFDERTATAYNRLGIIYAKQKAYEDAIECFEIAQSLEPNASSLHNVGLIYYETENYDKAALAFAQALNLEDTVASRHIAYAKVQEKFGDMDKAVESLERAVKLERNVQSLNILADAYEQVGRNEESLKLKKEAERIILPKGAPRRIKQPRKVVM